MRSEDEARNFLTRLRAWGKLMEILWTDYGKLGETILLTSTKWCWSGEEAARNTYFPGGKIAMNRGRTEENEQKWPHRRGENGHLCIHVGKSSGKTKNGLYGSHRLSEFGFWGTRTCENLWFEFIFHFLFQFLIRIWVSDTVAPVQLQKTSVTWENLRFLRYWWLLYCWSGVLLPSGTSQNFTFAQKWAEPLSRFGKQNGRRVPVFILVKLRIMHILRTPKRWKYVVLKKNSEKWRKTDVKSMQKQGVCGFSGYKFVYHGLYELLHP